MKFCPRCGARYDGDIERCEKCSSLLIEDFMSKLKQSKEKIKGNKGRDNLKDFNGRINRMKTEITENEDKDKVMNNLMKGLGRYRQPESEIKEDTGITNLIKSFSGRVGQQEKGTNNESGQPEVEIKEYNGINDDMGNLNNRLRFNGINDDMENLNNRLRLGMEKTENKGNNTNELNGGFRQPEKEPNNGLEQPEVEVTKDRSMNIAPRTLIILCIVFMAGLGVTMGILFLKPADNAQQYNTVHQSPATQSWHQIANYTGAGDHTAEFTIQGSKFKVTMFAVPKVTYSGNALDVSVYNENNIVSSGSLTGDATGSPNKKEYEILVPESQDQRTYSIVIHPSDLKIYEVTVWDYY